MQCTSTKLIVLFNFFNAVLSVLGIGLIALSVYELNNSTAGTFERTTIIVQIFVGSFVILTTFLGCFATCRIDTVGLIWSYVICMLILLLFQIYIIIAAHTIDYVQNATDNYDQLWQDSTLNANKIAYYEQQYNCCGKRGSKDYATLGHPIPLNCFKDYERTAENLFKKGCLVTLEAHALKSAKTGQAIKWIIFVFELHALLTSTLLARKIQNQKRRQQF